MELTRRKDSFRLGPYHFVTVHKGFVAGAYRKKGGEFMILPTGKTYQLNADDFEAPMVVKRDSHIVTVGPLTFLVSYALPIPIVIEILSSMCVCVCVCVFDSSRLCEVEHSLAPSVQPMVASKSSMSLTVRR